VAFRLSPVWWPVLAAASPVLAPLIAVRNRRFRSNRDRASEVNEQRIARAEKLDLPAVRELEVTVVVEERATEGFAHDPGVSYLLTTDLGRVLFDVGFGPQNPTLGHNAKLLGVSLDGVDGLAISHLHLDHMGGLSASRARSVRVSPELGSPQGKPCFLPDRASAPGFEPVIVDRPRALVPGIASTGPLARSLFFMGWTEEQALLVRVEGKGLVVIAGCGHQTMPTLMRMVRALSDEPLHAFVGGVHMPVTRGRGAYAGIQVQCFLGTGKAPWERIGEADVAEAMDAFQNAGLQRLLLSAHDSCDHALGLFSSGMGVPVEVLEAGQRYRI